MYKSQALVQPLERRNWQLAAAILNVGGYQMIVTPGSSDIATVKMQHEINLTQKSRKLFSILRCADTFFILSRKNENKTMLTLRNLIMSQT